MTDRRAYVVLMLFIVGAAAVESLGGWLTFLSVKTWYPQLIKPSWTPPDAAFEPVWTLLYLMMAIAIWLVWKAPTSRPKFFSYALFAIQISLNIIWSGLFFGMQNPGLALIDIAALWIAIAATMAAFWPISRTATYLLVPYLLWVTFATALNAAIWHLNATSGAPVFIG